MFWNFNPRTHVGCDEYQSRITHRNLISIHAPTWGATFFHISLIPDCFISIHAPTWGATLFPSRSDNGTYISIHAPTWGATEIIAINVVSREFQSTHPRGVRPTPCAPLNPATVFQSTHPRGVRQPNSDASKDLTRISIHAPTWGATEQRTA